MNIDNRIKNPLFWSFIAALYISTTGVSPESFVSWEVFGNSLVSFLSNPFQVITFAWAVVGIFTDTSTKGLKDRW